MCIDVPFSKDEYQELALAVGDARFVYSELAADVLLVDVFVWVFVIVFETKLVVTQTMCDDFPVSFTEEGCCCWRVLNHEEGNAGNCCGGYSFDN